MGIHAKFVHTNLMARDWRRLVDFYTSVFGCTPRPPERDYRADWLDRLTKLKDAHMRGIHLTLPGCGDNGPTLEIFSYDAMIGGQIPVANQPGYGHIAFAVEDVPQALAAVLAAGGATVGDLVSTDVAGVGRLEVVYARDPEGNIVELQKWYAFADADSRPTSEG